MSVAAYSAFIMTMDRPEALGEHLEILRSQTRPPERILVVDNGLEARTREVSERAGAVHHAFGENRGPAGAAAFGLARLAEQGAEHVLWADDDDPPAEPDALERLLTLLARTDARDVAGIAAVGARWSWAHGRLERLRDEELRNGPVEVDGLGGNQQILLRRAAVESIALPDERLFFGLEENEYCLRLRRAGWRLWVDGELMRGRRQRAGRLGITTRRSALPRFPRGTAWRQYYTTRNYIFMMTRTFGRPDLARREAVRSAVRLVTAWLRGPAYAAEFVPLQARAVLDGYRGRMGRTVEPRPKAVSAG